MPTVSSILEAFESSYPGIDAYGVYCQLTGKKIGCVFNEELAAIIESIGGDDPEEIADDLAVRLFASMRPSMRWNKFHRDSFNDLRKSYPRETLAYLLNRLWAADNRSVIDSNHEAILLYQWLSEKPDSLIALWLPMFLELDAKLNLRALKAPFTLDTFRTERPLSDSLEEVKAIVFEWHGEMIVKHLRDEKARESTATWYRVGNTLTKTAHVHQFMEDNPSQAKQKAAAKSEEKAALSGLLRTIMADEGIRPLVDGIERPKAKPTQAKPVVKSGGFGGRMPSFGKKKESNS